MTGSASRPEYARIVRGRVEVIARPELRADVETMLEAGSLYDWAARVPHATRFRGRGIAYGVSLPRSGRAVVVRHNRHGGALASITGDRFLPPTRAPRELFMSTMLIARGVATPRVLMYGVERLPLLARRADVVTERVPDARDLAVTLAGTTPGDARRDAAWSATRQLLAHLAAARIRHHDLNVKNVLITAAPAPGALVLDVDVCEEVATEIAARRRNAQRLLRSLNKLLARGTIRVSAGEMAWLHAETA